MELIVRADGGPDIGYGHLVRTSALARRFVEGGCDVTYLTRTPNSVREVCPDEFAVVSLEGRSFEDVFRGRGPTVCLVDSYEVNVGTQQRLRDLATVVVAVVDGDTEPVCADIVVNGNVHAPGLHYEWVGPEPTFLLGTDYLLLRPSIRKLIRESPRIRHPAERGLVTMGGSDVRNATPELIRALDGSPVRFDVIVGPGFENRDAVRAAATAANGKFKIIEDPPDLPRRMSEADLAVSATGTTVYELLALHTATIGYPQADNQLPIAEELHRRKAIKVGHDCAAVVDRAESVRKNRTQQESLIKRGGRLVDGEGTERVYRAVVTEL